MPSVRSHAAGQSEQARTGPVRCTPSFRRALAAAAVPVVIVLLANMLASAARLSEKRVVHPSTVLLGAEVGTASGATIPFTVLADDGVRLRVDGELLVDEWEFGRGEYSAPITYLSTGYHDVVVEYYDEVGEAEVRLWWE